MSDANLIFRGIILLRAKNQIETIYNTWRQMIAQISFPLPFGLDGIRGPFLVRRFHHKLKTKLYVPVEPRSPRALYSHSLLHIFGALSVAVL